MKRLIVADEAKGDLRQIRKYSMATWGLDQAQRYEAKIIARLAWLMRH
jgi:plasmid stabilization system protein ParE